MWLKKKSMLFNSKDTVGLMALLLGSLMETSSHMNCS